MEGQTTSLASYIQTIGQALLSEVSVADVVAVIGAIIALIAIPVFLWKFGRKGFAAVKAALTGRNAGI